MRYLYSAFLQPKRSRSATEWHVLTRSHSFYLPPTQPFWFLTLLRKHSPDGTTRTRRHTSDIVYCSIYRPRKDERLSWPSWLTYSGRLTHISGHPILCSACRRCGWKCNLYGASIGVLFIDRVWVWVVIITEAAPVTLSHTAVCQLSPWRSLSADANW